MARFFPAALVSLLLADPGQAAPAPDPHYAAAGETPRWTLGMDSNWMTLRVPGLADRRWPRRPHIVDGNVTYWRFSAGGQSVLIEARQTLPTPCTLGGRLYEDNVRVTIGRRHYDGCGGRIIATAP